MKLVGSGRRLRFREHTLILAFAVLAISCLLAVNAVWPTAFAVCIAIGGTLGALMVLYEVRLTKRIAQAEFVRDLQSGFSSDANISELWRKLLMGEDITAADRPLVSSYLTFFETLHLLLDEGALDRSLTDDLFRNRFFTAIGNRGVLDTALVAQAGSFANIHDLIADWREYLGNRVPVHPGYYSYVRAMTEAKGYEVGTLGPEDLDALLELQEQVLSALGPNGWLRANTPEMLAECLTHHETVGVRSAGRLVAAAVLYDAGTGDESIKRYLTDDLDAQRAAVNLKVVLVHPDRRRHNLARTMVELLEERAAAAGKREILCTIHPKNAPSRSLFRLLGYRRTKRITSAYGARVVYARPLPSLQKRWAR